MDSRRALLSMLDGDAAYLPLPAAESEQSRRLSAALAVGEPIDDDAVLVVSTSGTTGTPKGAMHTPDSLRASADATAAVLGGPGSWLLALPPHHIAGLQVMLRSLAAGHDPVVIDLSAGFDPDALPAHIAAMTGDRRYTSLVPTQLRKALDHPAAVAALAELDAILVGGAATGPALLARALEAGLPIVRTYGMSETAGGCVYDGLPLPGVAVRIDDAGSDGVGRVHLGGPTLARGYRHRPDHPAFAEPGWFRTDDLGVVEDGVLRVVGRADEAISSGALTVVPQVVEAVIATLPAVADCAVFGLPDARLGEQVVAALVPAPGSAAPTAAEIAELVTRRLDRYAAPRRVFVVDALPTRGPGKVDRRALRASFS
ncbi:MAG: o-succinylbenzoate--CoA ligase [Gordonia sp. (in: high G+C Gram-positive bacteria)]|uniref:o-succinylbenzoate--CoA ligase n=1 Tax=Gordonia sp. (in: high G+C Gram-positive bacteria) TaxID=84139 RepID=UPI003C71D2A6